jgi:hypothetical protein
MWPGVMPCHCVVFGGGVGLVFDAAVGGVRWRRETDRVTVIHGFTGSGDVVGAAGGDCCLGDGCSCCFFFAMRCRR